MQGVHGLWVKAIQSVTSSLTALAMIGEVIKHSIV
jgi:hypothetical protein